MVLPPMARTVCMGWLAAAAAQQVGQSQEGALFMGVHSCTGTGQCELESTRITMDMNWRWLHDKNGYENCLKEQWDAKLCPDPETCANNCAMEGVTTEGYTKDYAVSAITGGIRLDFPKAPRVYLLESDQRYKLFKLKNREFTFDVDVSTLGCGMNAALYLVEMPQDGDLSPTNAAGAKFGTGYCDAQCPRMKFIQGKANSEDFRKRPALTPELKEVMVGPSGRYGYCCAEMDIFEANREAGAFTVHPCQKPGAAVCDGKEQCGDKDKNIVGWCDKDGCGYSSYRMGDHSFWGAGSEYAVDTSKPVTIVTQFLTSDNTDSGDLIEIRRLYIQDGKLIKNSKASALKNGGDSITEDVCYEASKKFNATTDGFRQLGGLKAMGEALDRGMVMSMSVWDDNLGRMLWLDAERARVNEKLSDPGVHRGPCPFTFGSDKDQKASLKSDGPMFVSFTNMKYGKIGSTYDAGALVAAETPSGRLRLYGSDVRVPRGEAVATPLYALIGALAAVAAVVSVVAVARRRHSLLAGEDALPLALSEQ